MGLREKVEQIKGGERAAAMQGANPAHEDLQMATLDRAGKEAGRMASLSQGGEGQKDIAATEERFGLFLRRSRLRECVPPSFDRGSGDLRDNIWRTFRAYGAFREGLLLERFDGEGKLVMDVGSRMAEGFADMVTANLVRGLASIGCGACMLSPAVIDRLPGGGMRVGYLIREIGGSGKERQALDTVMPTNSFVLGLIREDGLANPLAISPGLMLIQGSGTMSCGGYDHETDFVREFGFWLQQSPKPFI